MKGCASMLDPHDRASLYEALRPPAGYDLDCAVGTSFTLDLEALLTAPIAFALHDARTSDTAVDGTEPVGLLESIRRYASRVTVYCQAGQISVPSRRRSVFTWLEDAVVEVTAPRAGRLFHPKVWAVRFREIDGDLQVLRVLCATRNLTFDTSWDTLLRLESEPYLPDRADAPVARQASLGELFASLPARAVRPRPPRRDDQLASLVTDVGAVPLIPPAPFSEVIFHVLDGTTPDWPFPNDGSCLVISPFVTAAFLERLDRSVQVRALLSREESLDRIPRPVLERVERLAVLSSALDVHPGDEPVDDGQAHLQVSEHTDPGRRLFGLHAKLFVFDGADGPRWFTGSANATDAAFGGNVEVLAELRAPTDHDGLRPTDFLQAGAEGSGFADMLVDYHPLPEPAAPDAVEKLDRRLDQLRHRLISADVRGEVAARGDDFLLSLRSDVALPTAAELQLDGLEVEVWPITLDRHASAQALDTGQAVDVRFTVTLEGISSFFGVRATARKDELETATSFLVNVPLHGSPEDRESRLLAAMLADPARLLRYLLMLLDDRYADDPGGDGGAGAAWVGRWARSGSGEVPLLELLLRAVRRDPSRLDHIDQLLHDLGEQRDEVLPPGFDEVWGPIWAHRQGLP
jgi:hypothetical protein